VAFADVSVKEAEPPFTIEAYDTLTGKQTVTAEQKVSDEHCDDAMRQTVYVPLAV
jgi:hypothetical protein